MAKKNIGKFIFKKHMSIGAMDAYEDDKYLSKCFVDTGDLELLTNTTESKCIVVARTGAGKSALLEHILETEDHVITLSPNELSLNYIANSNIIRFFEGLGIKLDIFYQLLWRHVLVVELIKDKFNIKNEDARVSFKDKIASILTNDKSKIEAIEYLMEWGDKFWLEADKRIKDITTKLEDQLSASADLKGMGVPLTAAGSQSLSTEIKEEVIQRAQNVVNNVQIQKLNRVIKLLADDIYIDPQKKQYILIDKLDDDWVDDDIRYRLIRALIETVKSFKCIAPVKIIICLRSDLIYRVFDKTRDSGFQEEKYEDFILNMHWDKADLKEVIDKRLSRLLKEQYTNSTAVFNSIFTSKPNGKKPIDYILDRTFMRPRDAIAFVNHCLECSIGKGEINTTSIKEAEVKYSKKRFSALCHEWFTDYPCLDSYVLPLKNKKNGFTHSDINEADLDEVALNLSIMEKHKSDPIKILADKMFDKHGPSTAVFRNSIFKILYIIGILGVKKASYSSVSWSHCDEQTITESEIKNSTHFEIHPMLHSHLGINSKSK